MQLPGALALAAAGAATTANGATVQITFSNSFLSTNGGNHLVTDIGGDGHSELVGGVLPGSALNGATFVFIKTSYGPVIAVASGNPFWGRAIVGIVDALDPLSMEVSGMVFFSLHDSGVNGGAATAGWLDVVATGRSSGEFARIEVLRFIFDDVVGSPAPTGVSHASGAFTEFGAAVPEPSGLGLLALGAVGVVARRRRAVAA